MNNKVIACLITSSPRDEHATRNALNTVRNMLANNVTIDHLFFYADGVDVANACLSTAGDDESPTQAWQHIANAHGIPLIVCVTAAEKRGISAETNLANYFEAHGMGEFFSRLHSVETLVQL
ncbi:DsrE family protein [Alteromonas sp. ASW11-36]|uniref:DsrE family protein n=1 Tax=Alteromonas arenosi TaxID=3055817 RepID=A0ABT7SZ34_9ALTE|nr:DsrE family protein [Alteromonas sp. ASW11-36]MDM7860807.1 DsrE family protein [Alteromonas sp. ASW11-36]